MSNARDISNLVTESIPSSLGTATQILAVNTGATAGEWVDAPTVSTAFEAVGTYCLAYATAHGSHVAGTTFAGSALRTANCYEGGGGSSGASNASLSGTWRLMGNIGYINVGNTNSNANSSTSVFVRIS